MIISIIGSGGKTTRMKQLLHQYKEEGKTVLMTTSTHMRIEEDTLVDPTYEEIHEEIKNKGYAFVGNRFDEYKIKALDQDLLNQLKKEVDVILIEADGSRGFPLKVPADYEPVIDEDTDEIILITSMKGLGKRVKDVVHRYELLDLDPEKIVDGALIQYLVRYYLKRYPDAVIEVKQPEGLYQRTLASLIEHNVDVTCIQKEWFMPQPKLVLLGAGHVSQYVEKTAHLLDFYTIVIDNREEFANKNIFTEAQEVHCVNYEEAEQYFPKEENTCYVIVTRGHKDDKVCLKKALDQKALYVGMIGSKGKVKKTMDALIEEGYDESLLKQVHAPIGLPIKSQTPAEIAISIMAEIIQIKNTHQYSTMTNDLYHTKEKGTLCIITSKEGSAPRGVGSMMLVTDEKIIETIGGGRVEYQAICDARNEEGIRSHHYELSNKEGATLGMICGGRNDVLFIPLK